ncbi:FecR family protein [Bdellovibrio bacteriovorus]|uniref:FecR family protein n=1 Tax=Bdellovibrio bacteriovorus TaxID=959 RepID=UPI0035A731B8
MAKVVGFVCFLLCVQVHAADKMYGVFMVVKGGVQIHTEGKTAPAKVGAKVYEGDKVVTAADSRAKIVMSDRNVLNLSPDTTIEITQYQNDAATGKKNVEIKLSGGKIRSNVEQTYDGEKSKFQIKTPTAVAGVRGTQFQAGFDVKTQMTSIVTFKGAVSLAAVNAQGKVVGSPVMVKKGEMTTAAPNAAPEPPKALPKEEMKQIDGDSVASTVTPGTETGAANAEAGAVAGGNNRDVASEAPVAGADKPAAPTSMIDSKDMDLGMAQEIKPIAAPVVAPPTVVKAPTQDTLKDVTRTINGKTKVVITPRPR